MLGYIKDCALGKNSSLAGNGAIASDWNNRDVDVGSGLLQYKEKNQKERRHIKARWSARSDADSASKLSQPNSVDSSGEKFVKTS